MKAKYYFAEKGDSAKLVDSACALIRKFITTSFAVTVSIRINHILIIEYSIYIIFCLKRALRATETLLNFFKVNLIA